MIEWSEDRYREIALSCFRYFGFRSFDEVDRLTVPEYEIMTEAAQMKWIDQDYRNHLQAYLTVAAGARKRVGKNKEKPVYAKFVQFYNYAAEQKRVKKKKSNKFNALKDAMKGGRHNGG